MEGDNDDTPYSPKHVLSQLSAKNDRNIFLWTDASDELIGGFRVDDIQPLSQRTFYRYVDEVARLGYNLGPDLPDYVIRQVSIVPTNNVFLYVIDYPGPIRTFGRELDPDSDGPVPPGDYALYDPTYSLSQETGSLYHATGRRCELEFPEEKYISLEHSEDSLKELLDDEWDETYDLSVEEQRRAIVRDQQCLITGTKQKKKLKAIWICPPAVVDTIYSSNCEYRLVGKVRKQFAPDMEVFKSLKNVITLDERAADLFKQNKIGVDVEDNYRICYFGSRRDDAAFKRLPFLKRSETGGPSDECLKEHFLRGLRLCMLGGDVRDDFQDIDLGRWLDGSQPDLDDPKWHDSELGRQLRQWVISFKELKDQTVFDDEGDLRW